MSGVAHEDERMNIYRFLLDNMMDHHRINLTLKLCNDVLGMLPYIDNSKV